MGVKTDSISCPNCGSLDIFKDNENIFHCNSCGGTFLVNVDDNLLNALKKIKSINRNPEESFTSGIATKVKFDPEEFKKEAFEALRDSSDAPSYIFDEMECGEVKLIDVPLIQVIGHADVNYSRLVGFDREEVHTEFKKYKDISGNEHIQPVEYTETKTDWHTENGMLSGNASGIDFNDEKLEFDSIINNLYDASDDEFEDLSDDVLDSTKINRESLNYLKTRMISRVYYDKITKSGDHQKNEKYDGRATIEKTILIIAKVYTLSIKLRNSEILLHSPAFDKLGVQIDGDFPAEDDADQFENKVQELMDERDSVTKKPKMISNISFILAAISFVLLLFIGFGNNILVLEILAFVIPVILIVAGIIYKSKAADISIQYKVKIDHLDEERENNITKTKQEGFKKFYN